MTYCIVQMTNRAARMTECAGYGLNRFAWRGYRSTRPARSCRSAQNTRRAADLITPGEWKDRSRAEAIVARLKGTEVTVERRRTAARPIRAG